MDEDYITRNLLSAGEKLPFEVTGMGYRQISLFDDVRFGNCRENYV
jgi:hypothetical protein